MPEPLHPLIERARHGGPDGTTFAGLDFSVNANPRGPNPALLEAAQAADTGPYPDPSLGRVRAALAEWHGLEPAGVVPAVGASELLHRLVRAYLPPGGLVVSVGPSFGELERAVELARGRLALAPPELAPAEILRRRPVLVYASSPNNPLGTILGADAVAELGAACSVSDALMVLDEAYAPFAPELETPAPHPSVVRLQSPGKVHGLVGLRLAYALAPGPVARALENLAPAWPLPAPTVAALEALPAGQAFVTETLPPLRADAARLAVELAPLGAVQHTGIHYLTLAVGDAHAVAAGLLKRGVRVRDCASFGLPSRVRIAARLPGENARLVTALRQALA